jgi:hypothetical protein
MMVLDNSYILMYREKRLVGARPVERTTIMFGIKRN